MPGTLVNMSDTKHSVQTPKSMQKLLAMHPCLMVLAFQTKEKGKNKAKLPGVSCINVVSTGVICLVKMRKVIDPLVDRHVVPLGSLLRLG
jgi:hypothetical protein